MQITLTTTNATADGINEKHLAALSGKLRRSLAEVAGDFGREYFPTQPDLSYKIGAQIMLLNNDTDRRWVNGSIGVIEAVEQDDEGEEYLAVRLQDDARTVAVYRHSWEVYRFALEDGDIVSQPVGTFTQYPFRLAWAITIHKSQGLTFDKAILDVRNVFAAGQSYVALSRLRSLDGLVLSAPFGNNGISNNESVIQFEKTKQQQGEPTNIFKFASTQYLEDFVMQLFDFSEIIRQWKYHLASYNKEENQSRIELESIISQKSEDVRRYLINAERARRAADLMHQKAMRMNEELQSYQSRIKYL
jgi:hypothetical protein